MSGAVLESFSNYFDIWQGPFRLRTPGTRHMFFLKGEDITSAICLINLTLFLVLGLIMYPGPNKELNERLVVVHIQGCLFIFSLLCFVVPKIFINPRLDDPILVLLVSVTVLVPFINAEKVGIMTPLAYVALLLVFTFTGFRLLTLLVLNVVLLVLLTLSKLFINSSGLDTFTILTSVAMVAGGSCMYRYLYYVGKQIVKAKESPISHLEYFPYLSIVQDVAFSQLLRSGPVLPDPKRRTSIEQTLPLSNYNLREASRLRIGRGNSNEWGSCTRVSPQPPAAPPHFVPGDCRIPVPFGCSSAEMVGPQFGSDARTMVFSRGRTKPLDIIQPSERPKKRRWREHSLWQDRSKKAASCDIVALRKRMNSGIIRVRTKSRMRAGSWQQQTTATKVKSMEAGGDVWWGDATHIQRVWHEDGTNVPRRETQNAQQLRSSNSENGNGKHSIGSDLSEMQLGATAHTYKLDAEKQCEKNMSFRNKNITHWWRNVLWKPSEAMEEEVKRHPAVSDPNLLHPTDFSDGARRSNSVQLVVPSIRKRSELRRRTSLTTGRIQQPTSILTKVSSNGFVSRNLQHDNAVVNKERGGVASYKTRMIQGRRRCDGGEPNMNNSRVPPGNFVVPNSRLIDNTGGGVEDVSDTGRLEILESRVSQSALQWCCSLLQPILRSISVRKIESTMLRAIMKKQTVMPRTSFNYFLDNKVERWYLAWASMWDAQYHKHEAVTHALCIIILNIVGALSRVEPWFTATQWNYFVTPEFFWPFVSRYVMACALLLMVVGATIYTKLRGPSNSYTIKLHGLLLGLLSVILSILDLIWSNILRESNKDDAAVEPFLIRDVFYYGPSVLVAPFLPFFIMERTVVALPIFVLWWMGINIVHWTSNHEIQQGIRMNLVILILYLISFLYLIRSFEILRRRTFCRCVLPYLLFLDDLLTGRIANSSTQYLNELDRQNSDELENVSGLSPHFSNR